MDGIFIRKKTSVRLVLLLSCGLFLVAIYIFLKIVDSEATGGSILFLILGSLSSFVAIFSMRMNHGAYIHVEENTIIAKYLWFSRLECSMDEVEFVLPQINTLTILLKNGKRHMITGIENPWDLGSFIRRQIFAIEAESPDSIRRRLSQVQAIRKKTLLWVLVDIALVFVNIFIAVLLTGGRDLHEFSQPDWILFFSMGAIELLTVIGLFYAAQRCGKQILPIEQLKYRLRGAIIATNPLPTNYAIAIYTDESYTGRIVVCGFPNDDSVFYCVQKIGSNLEMETVHTSEIYDSTEELPEEGFSPLIDITPL